MAEVTETRIHEDLTWKLEAALAEMDEREGELGPAELELYFQIEMYMFPLNPIFAPENREATRQKYLSRKPRAPLRTEVE
jgi:hypothetical protein